MKISVLTPCFNAVDFIERAIKSVMDQDYDNVEHIIMDAGSTDGTVDVLERYSHIIWKSEKDKGQSDAMNKAFAASVGDVIVYLNADDFFEPKVFGEVIRHFQSGVTDMVVGRLNSVSGGKKTLLPGPSITLNDVLDASKFRFPLNPVSYFYRRSLQDRVGHFPVENHFTMDYWFLLRAYKNAKIRLIETVLGNFDQHGANKSSLFSKTQLELLQVLQEFCAKNNIDSSPYIYNLFSKVLASYEWEHETRRKIELQHERNPLNRAVNLFKRVLRH